MIEHPTCTFEVNIYSKIQKHKIDPVGLSACALHCLSKDERAGEASPHCKNCLTSTVSSTNAHDEMVKQLPPQLVQLPLQHKIKFLINP